MDNALTKLLCQYSIQECYQTDNNISYTVKTVSIYFKKPFYSFFQVFTNDFKQNT